MSQPSPAAPSSTSPAGRGRRTPRTATTAGSSDPTQSTRYPDCHCSNVVLVAARTMPSKAVTRMPRPAPTSTAVPCRRASTSRTPASAAPAATASTLVADACPSATTSKASARPIPSPTRVTVQPSRASVRATDGRRDAPGSSPSLRAAHQPTAASPATMNNHPTTTATPRSPGSISIVLTPLHARPAWPPSERPKATPGSGAIRARCPRTPAAAVSRPDRPPRSAGRRSRGCGRPRAA